MTVVNPAAELQAEPARGTAMFKWTKAREFNPMKCTMKFHVTSILIYFLEFRSIRQL
jgi:hypothetical protein